MPDEKSSTQEGVETAAAAKEAEVQTTDQTETETEDAKSEDEPLGEAGKSALVKERDSRKAAEKQLVELQKQLTSAQQAQQDETSKLNAKLSEALAKLEKFEQAEQLGRLRTQVSKETGVPAEALRGNSLEELQAHAETLTELLKHHKAPVLPQAGKQPKSEVPAEISFVRELFGRTS